MSSRARLLTSPSSRRRARAFRRRKHHRKLSPLHGQQQRVKCTIVGIVVSVLGLRLTGSGHARRNSWEHPIFLLGMHLLGSLLTRGRRLKKK